MLDRAKDFVEKLSKESVTSNRLSFDNEFCSIILWIFKELLYVEKVDSKEDPKLRLEL